MEKIQFKNNEEPYLSAENLNQLQTNIKNAISGVVESGSNENGSWIKYANGAMICTHTARGSASGYVNVTYPQPFIGIPHIVVSPLSSTANYHVMASANAVLAETCKIAVTYINMSNLNDSGYRTDYFSYIAIGKWK